MKVKKSSKNTKILEFESENKAYQDEIIRLTHILDQIVQGQQQIEMYLKLIIIKKKRYSKLIIFIF